MSDDWISEDMRRARRRDYLFTIVIVLLLVNVGATVFLFAYGNHYLSDLRVTNEALKSQINSLNLNIQNLQSQISLLKYLNATINLNATEFRLLPQIYNETMFSVVLISVDIPGGSAQGSGFVYDKEGHIITNHHVVEDATGIEVTFIDGTISSADLVGSDPYSDLAVIDVDIGPTHLYPLTLGSSSDLVVGETVIAIGNPYGLSNSMTAGIVSQLSRELRAPENYIIVDVIQTDAAINRGNSGGPMLNLRGEVVGMNTAILTTTGEWSGIGFAIPSDTIIRELPSLIAQGSYDHPWIGVSGTDTTDPTRGALIVSVIKDGPSYGKLQKDDVIIAVDGYMIKSFYDLVLYIERNKSPGDEVIFTVIRGSQKITVTITLGVRPSLS